LHGAINPTFGTAFNGSYGGVGASAYNPSAAVKVFPYASPSYNIAGIGYDPAPVVTTPTPSPTPTPSSGGTLDTGELTENITPRDAQILGWIIALAITYVILNAFRWRGTR